MELRLFGTWECWGFESPGAKHSGSETGVLREGTSRCSEQPQQGRKGMARVVDGLFGELRGAQGICD